MMAARGGWIFGIYGMNIGVGINYIPDTVRAQRAASQPASVACAAAAVLYTIIILYCIT
jgi:hypothetical protein